MRRELLEAAVGIGGDVGVRPAAHQGPGRRRWCAAGTGAGPVGDLHVSRARHLVDVEAVAAVGNDQAGALAQPVGQVEQLGAGHLPQGTGRGPRTGQGNQAGADHEAAGIVDPLDDAELVQAGEDARARRLGQAGRPGHLRDAHRAPAGRNGPQHAERSLDRLHAASIEHQPLERSTQWNNSARKGSPVQDEAQCVIIGGGAMGTGPPSTHLAHEGWTDTLLIEKGELTSGSTWHAAGLIGQLRDNQDMTKLAKYTAELYLGLEDETGQATGYKQNGSLSSPMLYTLSYQSSLLTLRSEAAQSLATRT